MDIQLFKKKRGKMESKKEKETHRIADGEATVTTGAERASFRTIRSTC